MCYARFTISTSHLLSECNYYSDFHRTLTSLAYSLFLCMDLNQGQSFCPKSTRFSTYRFDFNSRFIWTCFRCNLLLVSSLLMFQKAIRTGLWLLGPDFLANCKGEHLFCQICFFCQNFISNLLKSTLPSLVKTTLNFGSSSLFESFYFIRCKNTW